MTTPPLHGHHHGPPSDELAELEQRDVAVAFVDLAGYSVFTEFCGPGSRRTGHTVGLSDLAGRLYDRARGWSRPSAMR
ncbi:hypothetical protein [Gordonia terrae]|uniref:hypothetical protein n=1 Tax=Gordonia terrae TaxID=2055 RepID=UPI00117F3504|nr:hypothetical protein [Gordonia terrae]